MVIKHIWFDFSETIAHINKEEHDRVKYAEYAAAVGKNIDSALKKEFENLYEEHHHSISDIFHSLGKPAGWWSNQLAKVEPAKLFKLAEANIPEMLVKIKEQVPISIFSNIDLENVLPALGVSMDLFEHVLSSGMVSKPKPALDGFTRIVELSKLLPEEILYIGDHLTKDILPAKEVGLQAGMMWGEAEEADYNFKSFQEILSLVS